MEAIGLSVRDSSRVKWWVLGIVCFALFMVNLDGNVVSLATPTIVRDFGATLAQLEWISNAYLLTFAVFLITLGRLGDELGRKKLFLGGLALFTVGSALCGAAQNIAQLILFRVIQGIGGSAMMPATLSLIAASFAPEERGRAMGFWGAVSGLAFIAGPIVGGYLTQAGLGATINTMLGVEQPWRYVFFLNVPFGLLAFVAGALLIPESKEARGAHRLDLPGVLLSSIAIFALTFAFIEGPRLGWWRATKPFVIGGVAPLGMSVVPFLFAAALAFGAAFLLYERRRRESALLDLALFRSTNYSLGMVAGVILNFALMGATFLLPLFFQTVLGVSPVRTGTILVPFALAILVTSPLAGILSDRVDGKWILVAGMAVLVASDLVMGHFRVDTRPIETVLPFVIMGIGMGLSMTPLTNLTLFGIPERRMGAASGVLSTTRQIGAVMGIAIFSVVLQSTMVTNAARNLREIPELPPKAQELIVDYVAGGGLYGTGNGGPGLAPPALAASIDLAMKRSFTDSINETFLAAALFGVLGVGFALFLRPSRAAGRSKRGAPDGSAAAADGERSPEAALEVR